MEPIAPVLLAFLNASVLTQVLMVFFLAELIALAVLLIIWRLIPLLKQGAAQR